MGGGKRIINKTDVTTSECNSRGESNYPRGYRVLLQRLGFKNNLRRSSSARSWKLTIRHDVDRVCRGRTRLLNHTEPQYISRSSSVSEKNAGVRPRMNRSTEKPRRSEMLTRGNRAREFPPFFAFASSCGGATRFARAISTTRCYSSHVRYLCDEKRTSRPWQSTDDTEKKIESSSSLGKCATIVTSRAIPCASLRDLLLRSSTRFENSLPLRLRIDGRKRRGWFSRAAYVNSISPPLTTR